MSNINWRITHIRRNSNSNKIEAVKCENAFVHLVKDVIYNIDHDVYQYYVQERTPKADVHVVKENDGTKYIRTDADRIDKNNLENLPLF